MALFNPQMSQAPSTFSPVSVPEDNTAANAINAVTKGLGAFSKIKADADETALENQQASAYASLFADTLETEAEVLQGQQALEANQQRFDALYADNQITEDERNELQNLQEERARLQNITNPRQRQVQLRMKYANFVNRFPHLTKEARITFGDAESRLEEVAQGAQGLVDAEAFEQTFGYKAGNATAADLASFRNMQRYVAERNVGKVYGQANFTDWSRSFQADVTAEMFSVGKRMQSLLAQQGALRTEDIDTFKAGVRESYMTGIRTIDQAVLELQQAGQFVPQESIDTAKQELEKIRDDMLKMSEGTDFLTRLENHNKLMEEELKYNMNIELGAITQLTAGAGGGGSKGNADLLTIQQVLRNTKGTQAAISADNIYGTQLKAFQDNIAQTITFLDNYDMQAQSERLNPSLASFMADLQLKRMDNGVTEEMPEAAATAMDLMDQGGTDDEKVEAMLSRAKLFNQAATRNNEVKNRAVSTLNNYALETESLLSGVGARVRKEGDRYVAYVSGSNGKLKVFQQGTRKLNNLSNMYQTMPVLGSMDDFESILDNYKNRVNSEAQELVESLNFEEMTPQMIEKTLNRLQTMYSLTQEEMQKIREQVRSTNGPETSGGGD